MLSGLAFKKEQAIRSESSVYIYFFTVEKRFLSLQFVYTKCFV